MRAGSDQSVDAQDAEGVLTSDRITETDIINGRWDNADFEVWRVNWADTRQRVLMRRGAIGQIRRGRLAFVAEVRSLAHVLCGKVKSTENLYYASFAEALCEGPTTGIGRIWADGKPMDLARVTWRWYPGDEAQGPDPVIATRMGAASTPAYRGTAYVVFEELALSIYGNRLPQLSFEVFRPLTDPDTAEGLTRAVIMIPASGEFTYSTQATRKTDGGATVPDNLNELADATDMVEALDRLQAMAPAVTSVSLVVAWFGDDLRAGFCKVRPGVEVSAKSTTAASRSANRTGRASALRVRRDDRNRPLFGDTPSDLALVQAIQKMQARGLRVTFNPFIVMDVPPGNTLPNP